MNIIGHQKQLAILNKGIEKKSIAQAYLFLGPENVGKFTIAMDFARKITGSFAKANPNILILKPEINEDNLKKKEIKIEAVKDLQHWLGLSSFGGNKKVAIIDDAHKLNKNSQSALLKTLEDAKEGVVVILISQKENKILQTVKSRCQKIKFATVSSQEMKNKTGADQEILFWAMGRPGLLEKMQNSKQDLDFCRQTQEEFKAIFRKNIAERMDLAGFLADDVESAIKKINLWLIILREGIVRGSSDFQISPGKKIKLFEKIEKSLKLLAETNANAKMIIENILISF